MSPKALNSETPREQVRQLGRKDKRDVERRRSLVATQLSTPEGRAFVWAELERHGIYDLLLEFSDAHAVGVFLGRRNAGLELLREVMSPDHADAFLLMQGEALQRRKGDAAEIDAILTMLHEGDD